MVSPSIVLLRAKMISFTLPSATLATSESISKSGRSDAIHRRNQPTQHMIESMILLGVLHCHHVLDVLHHADGRSISASIATDATYVCIADVMTHLAILHLLFQARDSIDKLIHRLVTLSQCMENQAQGCLTPDSGSLANSPTAFSNKTEGYCCSIRDRFLFPHANLP